LEYLRVTIPIALSLSACGGKAFKLFHSADAVAVHLYHVTHDRRKNNLTVFWN